jgi:hypothetical protein
MGRRKAFLIPTFLLAAGGFVALSWTRGQDQSTPLTLELSPSRTEANSPNFGKYNPLQKEIYLSAQRGADWLQRANKSDGRFVYGYLPALKTNLEGDHYLRQAGAAFALARAARFTGNPRHTAVARQAVLTLLLDTAPDDQDPRFRHTTLPSVVVNRLAAAGLLVLAINELPSPAEDLLQQSEALCAYIARQQRPDGALNYSDTPTASSHQSKETPISSSMEDPDGINYYPGEALYGLMRSQERRPAAWKTDVVRKAMPFYLNWWRNHKNMALVPWHTAAYAEAFLLTKERSFADAVCEMTDWMCGLQYVMLDAHHPLWVGGFMSFADGKPAATAPQVTCASYAEGLAEASRVAAELSDVTRHKRYREALERCLQFLTTLQYSDANTQHFADWYRPVLLGGFYASHQDGTLRIDYNQHAVCAMVQYLANVKD